MERMEFVDDGLVARLKSAAKTGIGLYLPIAAANSIGPQTFAQSLTDKKTLAAVALVAASKLAYDKLSTRVARRSVTIPTASMPRPKTSHPIV